MGTFREIAVAGGFSKPKAAKKGAGRAKAKNEEEIEEIEEAEEIDEIDATDGFNEAEDVTEEAEEADDVATATVKAAKDAAAEVVKAVSPTRKEHTMKVSLADYGKFSEDIYELVTDGVVSKRLQDLISYAIETDVETRERAKATIEEIESRLPAYGWRYQALKIRNQAIYDSKAEAEEAATDFISLGHRFDELFDKIPFYKNEDGSWGDPILEGSREYKLIKAAEANKAKTRKGKA